MDASAEATARQKRYGTALHTAYRCLGLTQQRLGESADGIDPKTIRLHVRGQVAPQAFVVVRLIAALKKEQERLRGEGSSNSQGPCQQKIEALEAAAEDVLGNTAAPGQTRHSASSDGSRDPAEPFRIPVWKVFGEWEPWLPLPLLGLGAATLVVLTVVPLAVLFVLSRATILTTGSSSVALADWSRREGATAAVAGREYVLRTPSAGGSAVADLEEAFEQADSVMAVDARVLVHLGTGA